MGGCFSSGDAPPEMEMDSSMSTSADSMEKSTELHTSMDKRKRHRKQFSGKESLNSLENSISLDNSLQDNLDSPDTHQQNNMYINDEYATRKDVVARRGSLAFGAAQRKPQYEEKMPKSTLKLGRRGNLDSSMSESHDDVNLGESTSSQLEFEIVIPQWKNLRKKTSKKRRGFWSPNSDVRASSLKDRETRMWEVFLDVQKMPEDNPGRRHAKQTYTSEAFQQKIEFLFSSIDTNDTGFLEQHEFVFLLDGLRGRMHHFLRNTKALYFMQAQEDLPPTDQEFVLSAEYKARLISAIQDNLFTWRMTPHAWAVDRALFANLVELIVCSTVHLVMTEAAKFPVAVPVAIELYLLMSPQGDCTGQSLFKSVQTDNGEADNETSQDSFNTSLFCRTVFDLHLISPPQTAAYVDETILESPLEGEPEGDNEYY